MKFIPRPPDESVNVSHDNSVASFVRVGLGALLLIALFSGALLLLAEVVVQCVPPSVEIKAFTKLRGYIKSSELKDYRHTIEIQELTRSLYLHCKDLPYDKLDVTITKSLIENAFAYPGGGLIITQGLLDKVKSENELAFVIGHEIGHHIERHPLQLVGSQIFRLVFKVIIGDAVGGLFSSYPSLLMNNGYSRSKERVADLIGLRLVYLHYGHLGGAFTFLERFAHHESKSSSKGSQLGLQWISSHPMSEDRIHTLKAFARDQGWPLQGPTRSWPPETSLVK